MTMRHALTLCTGEAKQHLIVITGIIDLFLVLSSPCTCEDCYLHGGIRYMHQLVCVGESDSPFALHMHE